MTLRIGSLCTGGGGLDMAVQTLFPDSNLAWVSETNPQAAQLLTQHHPGAPNIGTCNLESFAHLPPVDIVCGGVPPQAMTAYAHLLATETAVAA